MNGEILDLEVHEVENNVILEDEEAKVERLVKNGIVYKAGGLAIARMWALIANARARVM